MAAGSQAENGICALFVILAPIRTNKKITPSIIKDELNKPKLNIPMDTHKEIVNKIPISPNRFVIAVSILALNLLLLI